MSEATLPIKAQIQLKLSVLLNLAYYAETSIQESLSWTKRKKKSAFLFAKENEIVKIALETTEVSKPKLTRKALLTEVLHEAGTA